MLLKNLKNYLRNRRGVASIEAALGTLAMLTASLLAFDLHQLASIQTTTLHAAVTLADSVSRDDQLEADFVQKLAEFLHQEQFPTSNAVFVVSAVYKDPARPTHPPSVIWTKTVVLGPETVVLGLENNMGVPGPDDSLGTPLTSCSGEREISIKLLNNRAKLPGAFVMPLNELAIVATLCVERASTTAFPGAVYAHYIVPARADNLATNLGATN